MSKARAFGPAYDAYRRRGLRPAPDPAASRPYRCKGGPFDQQAIYLHSPGALNFSLGGQRGRYELGDNPAELVWKETGA